MCQQDSSNPSSDPPPADERPDASLSVSRQAELAEIVIGKFNELLHFLYGTDHITGQLFELLLLLLLCCCCAGATLRHSADFDKFIAFLKARGITCWNSVKASHLDDYTAWLDGEAYAYATEFFELTTIKQAIKDLIKLGKLPPDCQVELPLAKPTGTDTYCYREEQVVAMLRHCAANPDLHWMHDIIATLAFTGMRISELAGLRRTDVDLDSRTIALTDERYRRRAAKGQARTIKNKRSRSFPIHPNLHPVLAGLVRKCSSSVLFNGPKGGPLRPDHVRICLKRDVQAPLESQYPSAEEEIGFKNGRLHSFRHFFCSMCANSGVSEPAVMDWLGHRSSAMIRHYYHLHNEEAQRQMSKVSASWWPTNDPSTKNN
jgi:integrase